MSILVKGMGMPKTCNECKFFAWEQIIGNYCAVDENITYHAVLDGLNVCYERNGECPIIEAEPVKHGRWIYDNQFHWYRASCSECGYKRVTDIKAEKWNDWHYCPHCGAKMASEAEEEP